jgi:hypothetical protein
MAYTPLSLSCDGEISVTRNPDISRVWTYKTEDAIADVNTADYFANIAFRGAQVGDLMRVVVMSAGAVSAVYDAAITDIDSDGNGDISNGVSLTLTDSD